MAVNNTKQQLHFEGKKTQEKYEQIVVEDSSFDEFELWMMKAKEKLILLVLGVDGSINGLQSESSNSSPPLRPQLLCPRWRRC
ncbi:hypothetical protein YC2023_019481 [Brassica napus]